MNKETTIKELLEHIHLSEGDGFDYDEAAILDEYENDDNNQSSLAIKILSIFGGFLATMAFIGFLAIAGLYESEFVLFIFGLGFIMTAIWLNTISDKLIIDTFSISIYIIGFLMFYFGLAELDVNQNIIGVLVIVIGLICLFVTQNYLLSFISVLAMSSSLLNIILEMKIMNINLFDLIHLYVGGLAVFMTYWFLNESKIIIRSQKLSKLYDPIRIGLIISLLFGLMMIATKGFVPIRQNIVWISSIIIIPTILYLISIIIKINGIEEEKNKIVIYALSLLILLSTLLSPSISGALLILLLSFLVNYKTGLAIGIIALIYFIGQYYYDLHFTLLTKSIILFLSGVLFLIFYLFTNKKTTSNEKV